WGRPRGRRDAGAPPDPRLLWSESRPVRRGPRGAGRGGRLAARPERGRQDDDAEGHRRARGRDGRRDPVRGAVALRAPDPRDLPGRHRLRARGPAHLRRPHGGREPGGRRAAGRSLDARARLRALPEAAGPRRSARWEPLGRRAADADDRADPDDRPPAPAARRTVGGARARGRARARGEHRGPQGQRADDSAVGAEREVRPAARRPRLHHREGADQVRGAVRASGRGPLPPEGVPQRMKTLIRNIGQLVSGDIRPGGGKVHAGPPILEPGMVESDFPEMAAAGVTLVGEIGLGSVKTGKDAAPMVRWAKAHGMTVTIHTGGPSIAGSSPIDADVVLEASPDVVGHINGGTTSLAPAEIERLVATDMAVEIVQCGNVKTALHTLRVATAARATHRIIVGNDAPSGTGVIPLGVLRTLSLLAAVGGLPPAEAVACATGNTARVYRLGRGTLAEGREADLVICDAPIGGVGRDALSALMAGDLPGISMVLIDGKIMIGRSRNTAPAARAAEVVKGSGPATGGH